MWRMALVAAIAVTVYFVVPLAAPGPPSAADSDSFGKPWTLKSLTTAFQQMDVPVQLGEAKGTVELLPGLEGKALFAAGTIGACPGAIAVYSSGNTRLRVWREEPGSPVVWAKGFARIPEDHAWGIGNAVVFLSALTCEDSGDVQDRVVRLRAR